MDEQALAVALSQVVAVAFYLYLGVRLAQRPVSPHSRVPARQFAIFWLGLALSAATSCALSFVAAFGSVPLGLETATLYANFVIVLVALWGLLTYLTYLYTGRSATLPFSILYAVEFGLLLYYASVRGIVGVTVVDGQVGPLYGPNTGGILGAVALLLLVFPEIIAALLYFRLYFRTTDPTVRYRVTLVSWGLFAYFLLNFFGVAPAIGPGLAGVVASRVLLLATIFVVLIAYYPPAWLRERYGVSSVEEPLPTASM
jgi:hypothetical protein